MDRSARVWEPETELFDLFHLDISKPFKSIELTLDYVTGEPSGVQEVFNIFIVMARTDIHSSTLKMRTMILRPQRHCYANLVQCKTSFEARLRTLHLCLV